MRLSRPVDIMRMVTAAIAVVLLSCGCTEENVQTVAGAALIDPEIVINHMLVYNDESNETYEIPNIPDASEFRLILTDLNTGRQIEWSSLSEFDRTMLYNSGEYNLTAYHGSLFSEGFGEPCFYGSTDFTLGHSGVAKIRVECALNAAVIGVEFGEGLTDLFSDFSVLMHADGGGYVMYPMDENKPVFLSAGEISLSYDMTLKDGRHAIVKGATIGEARSNHFYRATINILKNEDGTNTIKTSFIENNSSDDIYVPVSEDLFDAPRPLLTASGFTPGNELRIDEGVMPDRPVEMSVVSSTLSRLILTTRYFGQLFDGWPEEVDLCSMTPDVADLLALHGLSVIVTPGKGAEVDFSGLLANLRYNGLNSQVRFFMLAVNSNMETSDPLELTVVTEPVDLTVSSCSDVVIGVNRAEIMLSAPAADLSRNLTVEYLDGHMIWRKAEDVEITAIGNGSYRIGFGVGEDTAPVNVRLLYCGQVKHEVELKRVSPEFTFEVDPYAHKAEIRISVKDRQFMSLVTEGVFAYVDGKRASIIERDVEKGIVTIGGLLDRHNYDVALTMVEHPSANDFTESVGFETEPIGSLPNGDFEEFSSAIDYKNMLSGGRYSQNYVEIFNNQNKTSFSLSAPKKWANTNDKTFCKKAKNHNTWYMQPSCYTVTDAAGGAYAVRLVSVGWDVDGQEIPDYLQESEPFVRYSRIVPHIANNAAGKLFIGSYSFDYLTCTESIVEGMTFNSRPSALNGYYKFLPGDDMPNDRGLARIEILGEINGSTVTIASGEVALVPAATYTAFSVPLSYPHFCVKATGIRVMLASTVQEGTIVHETNSIHTTPDPATASATASSLWIDELTLSY